MGIIKIEQKKKGGALNFHGYLQRGSQISAQCYDGLLKKSCKQYEIFTPPLAILNEYSLNPEKNF
jgi:hypothetical protein